MASPLRTFAHWAMSCMTADTGFAFTRDLDSARAYLRERYRDARFARYGIVASSKDKSLPAHGVDNFFQTTKQLKVDP